MINPYKLFTLLFIALISTYLFVFGQKTTLEIIKEEYLFIFALLPISFTLIYFKYKVKGYELIYFNKQNSFSLKSTIIFFIIFQIFDYFYEDGFIGMISQWFIYWIMGLIGLLLLKTINYYKNYQLVQKRIS